MKHLFQKWWVILIQGILLIILSFYVFNNPGATLLGISFWISLLILGTGIIGIVNWFSTDKFDRSNSDIIWSAATALFGLLLLAKIGFAMEFFTNLLGLWMLVTGAWMAYRGWEVKEEHNYGWVMIGLGVLAGIAGIAVVFNLQLGAVAVSTIFGMHLLLGGLALILLSLVKRKVMGDMKQVVGQIKGNIKP